MDLRDFIVATSAKGSSLGAGWGRTKLQEDRTRVAEVGRDDSCLPPSANRTKVPVDS